VSHRELLTGLGRGARLLLLEPGPVTWQRPLVDGAVEFGGDEEAAMREALELSQAAPIAAVLSYLEPLLLLAARIAHRTGRSGMLPMSQRL
jgi:hypothetical protein